MLGKLLGLGAQKSTLPKNQIEVVCPVCGAVQREPRLVVTTMCRKCGEHLRIEKRRVIASSQINPLSQEVSTTVPTNYYQASEEDHPPASPSPSSSHSHSHLHSGEIEIEDEPAAAASPPVSFSQQYAQSANKIASALLPDIPVEEDIPPGLGSLIMGVQDQDSTDNQGETPEVTDSEVPQPVLENKVPSTPFSVVHDEDEATSHEVGQPSFQQSAEEESSHPNPSADGSEAVATNSDEATASSEDDGNQEEVARNGNGHGSENGNGMAQPSTRGSFRKFQPIKRAEVNRPEASPFQKMREQGFRQQHFKEVECFDCHQKFKVGRSARNTQCPACSSPICLEDIDINLTSTAPIRTRGDVYIRKMGNVSTSEIKCRDLNVQGIISANVECTGELTIRTAGTIVGEIHCVRLQVIKGSDVQLINTIYAREVEIYARVCGDIHCDGPVLIGSGGCVEGDVTARSVNIEPGGHLDGGMNILRPAQKKAPPETAQQNLPLEGAPEA